MTTLTATPMVMLDVFVAPQSLFERFSSAKKWSWLALLILITLVVGSSYVFFNGFTIIPMVYGAYLMCFHGYSVVFQWFGDFLCRLGCVWLPPSSSPPSNSIVSVPSLF